jgi:hypothetical protein
MMASPDVVARVTFSGDRTDDLLAGLMGRGFGLLGGVGAAW